MGKSTPRSDSLIGDVCGFVVHRPSRSRKIDALSANFSRLAVIHPTAMYVNLTSRNISFSNLSRSTRRLALAPRRLNSTSGAYGLFFHSSSGRVRMNKNRLSSVVILLALMAVSLAGCAAPSGDLQVPIPTVGARALYEGTDGSRLSVEVLGNQTRNDTFGVARDVLVLRYVLWPSKRPDLEIIFEESVALATGLHLRQDLYCAFGQSPADDAEPCIAGHMRVFMGGHGLPGGLGAGPLWGRTISPSQTLSIVTHPLVPDFQLSYTVAAAGDCLQVTGAATGADPTRWWLPGTVLDAPFALCPGDIFPAGFVSHMAMPSGLSDEPYPAFSRVGQNPGRATVSIRDATIPVDEWVDPVDGSRTSLLSSPPSLNYTSRRAHEEALRLDDEYRSFWEANPDSVVAFAEHTTGGGARLLKDTVREEYDRWQLVLRNDEGQGVDVHVDQVRRHILDGDESVGYRIHQTGRDPWGGTHPPTLRELPLVEGSHAYAEGARIFLGMDPLGAQHTCYAQRGDIYSEKVAYEAGCGHRLYYRPPGTEGQFTFRLWRLTVDGLSGAVLDVQLGPWMQGNV